MDASLFRAWLAYPDSPDQPVYSLEREEQWIGRGEDCHIMLMDRYVSKLQAKVYWKTNLLILEDYGRNPVLLNGEPVKEVMLKDGDRLNIGSSEFVVRIVGVPAPQDASPQASDIHGTPETGQVPTGKSFSDIRTDRVACSEGARSSGMRLLLIVLVMVLVGGVLIFGAFFVYQKVLVPLRERPGHKVERQHRDMGNIGRLNLY